MKVSIVEPKNRLLHFGELRLGEIFVGVNERLHVKISTTSAAVLHGETGSPLWIPPQDMLVRRVTCLTVELEV